MKMETQSFKNLWDEVKAVLRGKFTATQVNLRKQKSQVSNLTLYLKDLEKTKALH